ncbi:MAG: hypothetical protein AB1486_18085 [Planctomycetota bacterium]
MVCACLSSLSGCASTGGHLEVQPFQARAAAELSADEVVDVMLQAGFSTEEILELGSDLRNALAFEGGARIKEGEASRAIFLVDEGYVYVAVRGGRDVTFRLSPPPTEKPEGSGEGQRAEPPRE